MQPAQGRRRACAEQSRSCEPRYSSTSVHRCASPPRDASPRRTHASISAAGSPAAMCTCPARRLHETDRRVAVPARRAPPPAAVAAWIAAVSAHPTLIQPCARLSCPPCTVVARRGGRASAWWLRLPRALCSIGIGRCSTPPALLDLAGLWASGGAGAHPQHLPEQAHVLVQQHQARPVRGQPAQHERMVRVVARLVARRPAAPQQLQRLLPTVPPRRAARSALPSHGVVRPQEARLRSSPAACRAGGQRLQIAA